MRGYLLMTKAEKLSALLAAALVIVCIFASFKTSPEGITTERSAAQAEIMTGGDGETSDELLPGEKININKASLNELCMLPGVGEALGQKIIDWREANGDFTSIDEIVDEIDGIGENSIENMRMFITLEDDVS